MIATSELKRALGVDAEDASLDEIIAGIERAAVAFVQNKTGWHFGPIANDVLYLRGSATRRLWLPQTPVGAVTVTELEYVGHAGTAIVEANDDGFIVRGAELIRKNGLVWYGGYEYAVTYARGYDAGTEPDDIRQLVIDLVAAKYAQRGKEGMKSETLGRYSYTFGDGDLSTIIGADAVIGHYRVPVAR